MDVWSYIALFVLVDLLILVLIFARRKNGLSPQDKRKYRSYWKKIKNASDKKYAVLEADKLLDALLKKKGYSGSLGEKLKVAGKVFTNVDEVWKAHKLRNRLAHEMEFSPGEKVLLEALHFFEGAFKDLGL